MASAGTYTDHQDSLALSMLAQTWPSSKETELEKQNSAPHKTLLRLSLTTDPCISSHVFFWLKQIIK